MEIVLVGVSQKATPLDVRERLALPAVSDAVLDSLRRHAAECVVLSTCNRTEIYAVVDRVEDGGPRLADLLGEVSQVERAEYLSHVYELHGGEAVDHLYSVAAGLDSMIVGESQILGQVSAAYSAASDRGLTGPVLNWVFPHALSVGKRVRAETGIGRSATSVGTVAVELARRTLGSLANRTVLVVGAGRVAELTTKALLHAGAGTILVANRTHSHAVELATRYHVDGADLRAVAGVSAGAIARADVVVSSTGSPSPILTANTIREAMRIRPERPLFLIDLAVPRDVGPGVRDIDNVTLFDIDDLQAVSATNHELRRREAGKAEEIVAEEMVAFERWWEGLRVVPTIVALRKQAEEVRQTEVRRALRRLGTLSDEQRSAIDSLTSAIVNKLLHQPTVHLRATAGSSGVDYDSAIRELFDLPLAPGDTDPCAPAQGRGAAA